MPRPNIWIPPAETVEGMLEWFYNYTGLYGDESGFEAEVDHLVDLVRLEAVQAHSKMHPECMECQRDPTSPD